MFEKESKEYANKWLEHVKDLELQHKTDDKPEYIRIEEAYQKGAEFGYNKANEWHYPSKGEYPKEEDEYLVIFESDRTNFSEEKKRRNLMVDSKIRQLKGALLKCAEENRNKPTPTFNINVSRLCEDAELRIRELEEGYKTIKEKLQNNKWLPETCIDDAIDFIDKQLGE